MLVDTALDHDGIAMLALALNKNRTLRELYLGLNVIGRVGACSLANVLKRNTSICLLDLSGCQIGDEGVEALANMLHSNSTLSSINLRLNNVNDSGAVNIANALKVNKDLVYLDLRVNNLAERGAQVLIEAVKQNQYIQYLDIDGKPQPELERQLSFNRALKKAQNKLQTLYEIQGLVAVSRKYNFPLDVSTKRYRTDEFLDFTTEVSQYLHLMSVEPKVVKIKAIQKKIVDALQELTEFVPLLTSLVHCK